MRRLWIALPLLALLSMATGLQAQERPPEPIQVKVQKTGGPPKTVPSVNLNSYLGKWYEIARIPSFFQDNCFGNTLASYSMLPEGKISVINSCDNMDGKRLGAEGEAKVTDPPANTKLRVTFVRFFGIPWYFLGGDYWVIGLSPDYSWAVIGHPDRKYAWILSRSPEMSASELRIAGQILKQQGYDTCRLKTTRQAGGLPEEKSLCQVSG